MWLKYNDLRASGSMVASSVGKGMFAAVLLEVCMLNGPEFSERFGVKIQCRLDGLEPTRGAV